MSEFVDITTNNLRKWVCEFIDSQQFVLLSTISGYQQEDKIYIVYHFVGKDGPINIRTFVPINNPVLPSITPVLPGGVLYEREIQDLLGVRFEDIIDKRRLILPEDWPNNIYPLRKDYQTPKEEKYK